MTALPPPTGLLAELTHRCPQRCVYCSNPVELVRKSSELDTAEWQRVFRQAARLGVIHVHLSGGEPAVRDDLEDLVAGAEEAGLYTNLITSGVLLDECRVQNLADAGLAHIQLSVQDSDAALADHIGGHRGAHLKKMAAAGWIRAADLPLTLNAVVHRQNLAHLPDIIDLAVATGAERLEVAHAQYQGWALKNRDALLPTRRQLDEATKLVEARREELRGVLTIDYVVPDYHAIRPKACMGGWGRQFLVVAPNGDVLPCHAAASIPELKFDNIRDRKLSQIWQSSSAFEKYRGTDWMSEPCQSCPKREQDWGGCRCQAFALTGDAGSTDPVCALSPDHHLVGEKLHEAYEESDPKWHYRGYSDTDPVSAILKK